MRAQSTNLNRLSLYDQVSSLESLIARHYMILSFEIIMKNQRQKGILKLSLNSQPLVGKIFIFTTKITINTKYRSFQCKILNVFYLNKILFKFGNLKSSLWSFFKSAEETITHLFSKCLCAQYIWNQT